jgi:hypothetical protein
MWNTLTPQQQQLIAMLMRGQNQQMVPGMQQQLGNPLMLGGNSAVTPQQQAAMQQYQALLNGPQGWGAGANGNVPVWQLLMGRSPWYGQGTAVP